MFEETNLSETQSLLIRNAELLLENQRLREALVPFVALYDRYENKPDFGERWSDWVENHYEDYKNASDALRITRQLILATVTELTGVKTNPHIRQEAPDATPAPVPVPTPTPQIVPRPALPTISSDPKNTHCPFKIGDRVKMARPFHNQFGIEVGDRGSVVNGVDGISGVSFDKKAPLLITIINDVFTTDLCEKIADEDI